jgi:arabinogalactan oligomer/maltooligosaccharide transport system permease protein
LALAALAIFVIAPIWGLAFLAFDGDVRGWPTEFRLWPAEPTLEIFAEMWRRPTQSLTFLEALRNSLIVSGGAAALAAVCGLSMAYAFARFRFPGRATGLFALLVGALLPPVALMTPLYMLLTALQLRTSLLGLTIVYTAFAMPFCVWNMRAAFQSVPVELEESALLEGAGAAQTFLYVTLPLALPAIAVAMLLAFLTGYTEFALGWLFVDKGDNVTLAMAIAGMFGSAGFSWTRLSALALYMTVPVVVLFLLLRQMLMTSLFISTGEAED